MAAPFIIALSVMMFLSMLNNEFQDKWKLLPSLDECKKEVQCAVGSYPPQASWRIPQFAINLDSPPDKRWIALTGAYKSQLQDLVDLIKDLVRPVFGDSLINFVNKHFPALVETLPYPFPDEMKSIANVSGIPLGEIALYNIFYEVFTVCTSILAQTESGHLYHSRNMDFGLLLGWDKANNTWLATEKLRKMTVQLTFQRGGKTLFKSTSFAGYVGVLTAMKPGMFSLTVDERFKLIGGYYGILKWVLGSRSATWVGFLTRQVMENTTSYSDARNILAETELLAPVYFILGGNKSGEASIITRHFKASDVWDIGSTNDSWYLVETNYDHWESPPCYDDRRNPAKKCLNQLGQQKLSFSGLFDVLSTRPVLNKLTVYSTLMEVSSGKYESYKQYCPDPCPLF